MLDCADLEASLASFKSCKMTEDGLRVSTDCLLPSFEQVHVYVVSRGGSYVVHDNAAAAQSAWLHGVDHAEISADVLAVAKAFSCQVANNQISVDVPTSDWLWAAIASVANASAEAARRSVGKTRVTKERALVATVRSSIERGTSRATVIDRYPYAGTSGKEYKFDLGVVRGSEIALIDAVSSHPASVAFKHLAFSDVNVGAKGHKFIVHEGDLLNADRIVLSDVADLIAMTDAKARNGWNVFA